jgi:hypothetical protein
MSNLDKFLSGGYGEIYKSDALAQNKWRIENREQLREQRKQELKELMEKDNQIPTAEQFLNRDESGVFNQVDIAQAMIEFAKLHVEAALKAASEKAETLYEPHWSGEQEGSTCIDKDSILNAYPLTNIK